MGLLTALLVVLIVLALVGAFTRPDYRNGGIGIGGVLLIVLLLVLVL